PFVFVQSIILKLIAILYWACKMLQYMRLLQKRFQKKEFGLKCLGHKSLKDLRQDSLPEPILIRLYTWYIKWGLRMFYSLHIKILILMRGILTKTILIII